MTLSSSNAAFQNRSLVQRQIRLECQFEACSTADDTSQQISSLDMRQKLTSSP